LGSLGTSKALYKYRQFTIYTHYTVKTIKYDFYGDNSPKFTDAIAPTFILLKFNLAKKPPNPFLILAIVKYYIELWH